MLSKASTPPAMGRSLPATIRSFRPWRRRSASTRFSPSGLKQRVGTSSRAQPQSVSAQPPPSASSISSKARPKAAIPGSPASGGPPSSLARRWGRHDGMEGKPPPHRAARQGILPGFEGLVGQPDPGPLTPGELLLDHFWLLTSISAAAVPAEELLTLYRRRG